MKKFLGDKKELLQHLHSKRNECLYHYAVDEYVKHILNSAKVGMAESNRLLEDSDSSSEGSNTIIPIKRLQYKRSYVDPEDSVNFLDYSGQSEDQDEGDACGASQLKQTSVDFSSDYIEFDKTEPSVVNQSSLLKPKLTPRQIRKMRKKSL